MNKSRPTFGDVVDAYQAEVLRYLRRLTGDASDAEDLFQETFLRALPAFRRLRAGANHRAWVYRIATNVFLNHRRRLRRRREVPLTSQIPSRGVSPAGRFRAQATAAACRRAIVALPPRQRAAFVQRNVLGWSYAQIADAMGGNRAAARANVYQASRRLRRELVVAEAEHRLGNEESG
jgi:RNA polymerase sigma-70 factor (ECF subfamily)